MPKKEEKKTGKAAGPKVPARKMKLPKRVSLKVRRIDSAVKSKAKTGANPGAKAKSVRVQATAARRTQGRRPETAEPATGNAAAEAIMFQTGGREHRAAELSAEPRVNTVLSEHVISEKEDRAKRMIMWSGVIFFMILITAGWFFSLRRSLPKISAENEPEIKIEDWGVFSDELSEKMNEMKAGLEELRAFAEQEKASSSTDVAAETAIGTSSPVTATGTALTVDADLNASSTSTSSSTALIAESIERLKERIEERER